MRIVLNNKVLAAAALLWSAAAGAPTAAGDPPRVVATFSLLGDWARAVGGPDLPLTVLVGPGGDAHTYAPTPADGRALAQADLILEIGLGFEPWLEKLLGAADGHARRVRVTEGMEVRRAGAEADPHVWGDVTNAERAVDALRDAFAAADPSRAAEFRRRAEVYKAQLRELDGWIKSRASRVPPDRRVLVTTHDTLGYWAARYGFRVEGSVLSSFSTEAADPSAAELARLADRMRALRVPAVFVEAGSNRRTSQALALAAGARLAPDLTIDTLGPAGSPEGTYIGMMKRDADVIAGALE